ncbi:TolC family protein [Desulfobotulus sp. H1]|uniref:TolC family protein n=1 Tax=Desulfobotulus pelophilus TaxID=2823377 RepID=A0ABT3N6U2_9BACT|nr:TolC family protein [Desulfobotulus pelophilus]MCW7753177.1 TolC family protein [Desulfobotulus pelophilus]
MKTWFWLPLVVACMAVNAGAGDGLSDVFPAPVPLPVPDRVFSLRDAVAMAKEGNPDMVAAQARIRESEAVFMEAGAGLWPRMGLSLTWTGGDAPSSYLFSTIDQRRLPQNVNFNEPGSFRNTEAMLWGEMRLFNGGRTRLFREMAALGSREASHARDNVENHLVAAVIDGFYRVKAMEDFLLIAEEALASVARQLEVMTVRYEGGSVLKSDLLSMEVRLAEVMEEKVMSGSRLRVARAALAALMGFCPGEGVRIGDADFRLPLLPTDGENAMALAMKHRAELKAVALSMERSRRAVRAEQLRILPTLDLQARYWHDDRDWDFDRNRENWDLSLRANWEFFDGFSRRAGRQGAEAREAGEAAKARNLLLYIRQDVEEALSDVVGSDTRYEVAARGVIMAKESLELVRRQYGGGAATVTRYLQAELDHNRAQVRKTAALYDRERARADLARALGLLGGEGF